jgi:nitroreductase
MKLPKKEYKKIDGLSCIITMTAGYPQNNEIRTYPDGFKRNPAKDIIIGDAASDNLIEAVRIAPSAVNLQPWLIEKTGNRYNFYLRPPKSIMDKMIGKMRYIDIGIAMAHLFIQAKADGLNVSFDFNGKDINQGKFIAGILTG